MTFMVFFVYHQGWVKDEPYAYIAIALGRFASSFGCGIEVTEPLLKDSSRRGKARSKQLKKALPSMEFERRYPDRIYDEKKITRIWHFHAKSFGVSMQECRVTSLQETSQINPFPTFFKILSCENWETLFWGLPGKVYRLIRLHWILSRRKNGNENKENRAKNVVQHFERQKEREKEKKRKKKTFIWALRNFLTQF